MIPPGLEPGTLCVLGTRDNHYTTESWSLNRQPLSVSVSKILVFWKWSFRRWFHPGSNWGPCACKAHVITTTLWNPEGVQCRSHRVYSRECLDSCKRFFTSFWWNFISSSKLNISVDTDVIWTRNLVIWSHTRYHCATAPCLYFRKLSFESGGRKSC